MDTQPVDTGYFEALLGGRRREAILVAAARKRVIAWGIVKQYSDRPGYQYACETSVYVANAHQGRGYGSTLLTAVVARAQALGYRHLVAKIQA
ncbi:MAG: GNAT family N-acetyltransferase, partial [Gammaproteobacteria bacterium]|nr:GNAT family N-acetyltransferase [Gammaproteobacteria bacterium]